MTDKLRPLPIIFSFRRCPYAMRARMAIALSKRQCELREILLKDKPPLLLTLSPKGTVPVLWMPDDSVLEESLDIMYWAVGDDDPAALLAVSEADKKLGETLIKENDETFAHHLARYKYPEWFDEADPLAHREQAMQHIMRLEDIVSGKKWLFGEQPTFFDLALLPFIRQFRIADETWFDKQEQCPNVKNWLVNFLQADWFRDAMAQYPVWQEGDEPIHFPKAA